MDEGGAAMKPTAKSTAGKATKNATQ
jgi:hypothetical protein